MNCQQVQERILEAPADTNDAMQAHLQQCNECRAFAETVTAVTGLASVTEPARAMDVAVLREAHRRAILTVPRRTGAIAFPGVRVAWLGAAALLVIGFALHMVYQFNPVPPRPGDVYPKETTITAEELDVEILMAAAEIELLQAGYSTAVSGSAATLLDELYLEQVILEMEQRRAALNGI